MHSTRRDPMEILLRSSRSSKLPYFPILCATLMIVVLAAAQQHYDMGLFSPEQGQQALNALASLAGLSMAIYHSRHGRILEALRNSGFTESLLLTGRSAFWLCDGLVVHSVRSLMRWAVPFYLFDMAVSVLLDRHGSMLAIAWLPNVIVATVGACYIQLLYAAFRDRQIARSLAACVLGVTVVNTCLLAGCLDVLPVSPATIALYALSAVAFAFERMLLGFEINELERGRSSEATDLARIQAPRRSPILQREHRRQVRRDRRGGSLILRLGSLGIFMALLLSMDAARPYTTGLLVGDHALILFAFFLVIAALTTSDAAGLIARERAQHTLELLAATPLRTSEYLRQSLHSLVQGRLLYVAAIAGSLLLLHPGLDRLLYCVLVLLAGVLLVVLSACIGFSIGLTARSQHWNTPAAWLWSFAATVLVWNPVLQTLVEGQWTLLWPIFMGTAAVAVSIDLLHARLTDASGCLQLSK